MKINWNFDGTENPPEYLVNRLRGTSLISRADFNRRRIRLGATAVAIAAVAVLVYVLLHSLVLSVVALLPLIGTQPMLDSYEEYEAAWRAGNIDFDDSDSDRES